MLLNRLSESLRSRSFDNRLLRRRALAAMPRPSLIVVPSVLGTTLVDGRGRRVWGGVGGLFRRFGVAPARPLAVGGFLDGFTILPGLLRYDIVGGLVRFLERVGGYRRDHDLHVLAHDWRQGAAAGARALAQLVGTIRSQRSAPVDLLAVSSGGLVARYFLAAEAEPGAVRRTVFVGTPQAGSFAALATLLEGLRFVPLGRLWRGHELAAIPTLWELLPPPGEKLLVDERGETVEGDLHDAATWHRLKIQPAEGPFPMLDTMLASARAVRAVIDSAPAGGDAVVIAARNQATRARLSVRDGVAHLPPCEPRKGDPRNHWLYQPGDGLVPAASAGALPGLDPGRVWSVRPREHHRLASDPTVQRYVLEALLATDRPLALTDLTRTRVVRLPGMPARPRLPPLPQAP